MSARIVAVIAGTVDGERLAACRDAVERQTHPVAAVYSGADALAAAFADGADWFWVLEGAAVPRPEALADLIAAIRPPGGEADAAVIAGLLVDAGGRPIDGQVPAGRERETEEVLRLARLRLLPIRRAGFGSTLVSGAALARHGLPSERYGAYAPLEWTARVLRESPGYLVPASLAVADPAPAPRADLDRLVAAARMTRTGTWTRGETARAFAALVRSLSPRSNGLE